jgi:ATP-binding cassette, subfamily B, bacterial RamB/AmfA
VMVPIGLGLALFAVTLPAAAARQRAYVASDERLAARADLTFAGLRDITACGAGERAATALAVPIEEQAEAQRAVTRMAAARGISFALAGWLPVVIVLLAAPSLVRGGMTAGAVLGALTYLLHGVQPALNTLIGGLGGGGIRLTVTIERILRTAVKPAVPRPAVSPRGSRVRLRQTTFSYGRHAEPLIDNLDLQVADGDHLAIVGPSGIGKSTLVGLLAGTLQPTSGAASLGGVPTRSLDAATLARHRVLIPQEAYLFTGTLLDNLRYLRPDASESDLARAVHAVGLDDLVRRHGGYRAQVTPDALSAGERQLVALARAYLAAAPLVLLDEATCHLDPAAEARAERAFAARPGALVVVAHRISSAARARRVLLMDGATATVGTDQSLRLTSPLYRDLVGHWTSAQPAGTLGHPDGLQPVAGAGLADDR